MFFKYPESPLHKPVEIGLWQKLIKENNNNNNNSNNNNNNKNNNNNSNDKVILKIAYALHARDQKLVNLPESSQRKKSSVARGKIFSYRNKYNFHDLNSGLAFS